MDEKNEHQDDIAAASSGDVGVDSLVVDFSRKLFRRNFDASAPYTVEAKTGCTVTFYVTNRTRTTQNKRDVTGKNKNNFLPDNLDEKEVTLDLSKKFCHCKCLAFGMHGICCKHVFAVLKHLKRMDLFHCESTLTMCINSCYLKSNLKRAYEQSIDPMFNCTLEETATLGPIILSTSKQSKRYQ